MYEIQHRHRVLETLCGQNIPHAPKALYGDACAYEASLPVVCMRNRAEKSRFRPCSLVIFRDGPKKTTHTAPWRTLKKSIEGRWG